jgi:hypothetical protein
LTTEVTARLDPLLKTCIGVSVVNDNECCITFCDKEDKDIAQHQQDEQRRDKTKTISSKVKLQCYGVIEVGIATKSKALPKFFFEKLCQGLTYLDMLESDDTKGESEAMILSHNLNEGCFADFFCKRRRMSLLSKVGTSSRDESLEGFATTVAAIVSLKDFVPGGRLWNYLGPNCCKVSIRVLVR